MQMALQAIDYTVEPTLYMALELSDKKWKLVFSDGTKRRSKTIEACTTGLVLEQIALAKRHFKLPEACRVVSCYEAGWEGFWLARWLCSAGVINYVVDSSAIEVNRKRRQAKTDRLDGEKLLEQLIRFEALGQRRALSVVRVPSREEEDDRRLHRERAVLVKERNRHWVRIKSLLRGQGLRVEDKKDFLAELEGLRCWDGRELPGDLRGELDREWARHEQANGQVQELEKLQRARVQEAGEGALAMVRQLMQLKSVGWQSAWLLVMEFFAWRGFRNRRELGSLAGLAPTPYSSGQDEREQGISKAGNRRVRTLMIELSWLWLRHQPHSALSQWYYRRFGGGGKRLRRIGIVALARKLLVALWRYLAQGELPAGAQLKT